ncbi:hypothetical protein [Halobacillus massiliensis]|uniref:hypothetical protein n=1 Tax=Halobacillus massiliensis TaxID=1926286 RepID=UPI00117ADEA9|nr:hypothetical protein [Halobacillus massiliensis]
MNLLKVDHPHEQGAATLIVYEDKGSTSSVAINYEPAKDSLNSEQWKTPILALAYFIKHPEAKHRPSVTISKEDAEQVVSEMNLNAVQRAFDDIESKGNFELTSTLEFYN